MLIIDTSAWIEYYRKNGNMDYKKRIIQTLEDNTAAICGIIITELLVHTKTKKEYQLLETDFSGMHWLETDYAVYIKAAAMGFDLKRKGITIPLADLVIASCAFRYKSAVIHFDKHYEIIKQHYPLRTVIFVDLLT
jgi:predicted nucleic acid-binding protein